MAEEPYHVKPRDSEKSVWIHDFSAAMADGRECELSSVRRVFQDALARIWRGEMEDDGFNRLVLGAGFDWRDGRHAARLLQVPAPGRRRPSARTTWKQTLSSATRDIAVLLCKLFHGMFDPGRQDTRRTAGAADRRGDRGGAGAGHQPGRGPHRRRYLNAVQCDPAHEFLSSRRRTGAEGLHLLQAGFPRRDETCRCRGRWSRSSSTPARGGDPSARRQGGARRHPLVRPARGFPHRDPWPDEGADGEERGDRADGSKGGFVVKRPPRDRWPRSADGRGGGVATRR